MLSSFSHNFISNIANAKFCMFIINKNKSFLSQNLKAVGSLGGKFDFFTSSGFEIQIDFGYKISNFKLCSVRALKRYTNKKNQTHGRVIATISKFSAFENFETHFSW